MEASQTSFDVEQCRQQLRRILDSADFAARRQLSDFLLYASDAAFQGRTHLEQVEIAEHVLHRNREFNPVDDASVRKMATLTRQRLETYYSGPGARDAIVVTLPVRSYIPKFRGREELEEHVSPGAVQALESLGPQSSASPLPRPNAHPRHAFQLLLIALGLAVALGVAMFWARALWKPSVATLPVFDLTTVRGDFMHSVLDLPGRAIQVGPRIADLEDATVRMSFTPEQALQQAGLLIFNDPDRYVKLGRQFLARPQLEFGLETQARYRKPPNTFVYDPSAENGRPVWLSIRREHSIFKAFLSFDGDTWIPTGNTLNMPDAMPDARIAIFAHHGHSTATPAHARFDRLSIGHEFHSYPDGPADLSEFDGWHYATTCAGSPSARYESGALVLPIGAQDETCQSEFFHAAPGGDWTVATKLDFLSANGTAAGLRVRGSRGQFRVIRWDLNGGYLTAENLGFNQAGIRDFPGSPPVAARIDCRNGVLHASFSRNEIDYIPLPITVRLADLGSHPEYGITVLKSTWGAPGKKVPARFFYVRQYVRDLRDFR